MARFRLVREALAEREVLLTSAPHIIRPLPFVLLYARGLRPRSVLRLGLFLYDHLGGHRTLPAPKPWRCAGIPMAVRCRLTSPAVSSTRIAVWTMPGWSSSMRVMLRRMGHKSRRARRCAQRGAKGDHWLILIANDSVTTEVGARILVNAAGPWLAEILRRAGVNRTQS
jgi:glycerol-3-phosphate dehydrogenase